MIRIGLMLDGTRVNRWKYEVIEAIRRTGCAEIALVITNQSAGTGSDLGSKLSHGTFHAYRIADRMLFPVADDPFEMVDLQETIGTTKELKVVPQMKRFSDRFTDQDVAAIKSENLDILIRFGFRVLRGPILDAAKHGVCDRFIMEMPKPIAGRRLVFGKWRMIIQPPGPWCRF